MIGTRVAAVALLLSFATPALAQQGSPGTAGASNAAASSPGVIPPSVSGTGPGTTSPGMINGAPQAPAPAPPAANPNQVPNTGPLVNSTRSATAPATVSSGSRAERGTVGSSAPQQSQEEMDKALNESVNKKIKDICKGC